jgi:hypothetical protein
MDVMGSDREKSGGGGKAEMLKKRSVHFHRRTWSLKGAAFPSPRLGQRTDGGDSDRVIRQFEKKKPKKRKTKKRE